MLKKCSKCGLERNTTEFYKDKRKKDGFNVWCKSCSSEYGKEHYDANRDKLLKQAKEYRAANKDVISERRKEHYADNKDKILKQVKEYYVANKDARKKYRKEYYAANKDYYKEYQIEYVKNNPEKFKNLTIRRFCSIVCKPLILARDNHQCVNCGSSNNGKLIIHHMLPAKHAQEHILNPRNLITLCPKCHLEAHSGCYKLWNSTLNKKLLSIVKQKELDNPTVLPTLWYLLEWRKRD